jgi:AcrR family transcriptional regulator
MPREKARRRDAGRARGLPVADAVLAKTLEELAVHGLEGLSVERIARAADLNKTSVYRRWPTKEALVVAALEGMLEHVEAQLPDTGSLRGDLEALLLPIAHAIEQPVGRALLRAALADSSASVVAAMAADRLTRQTSDPVKILVSRARARGEWRAGAKGEQVIFMMVGAVMHRVMLEHAPVSPAWIRSMVDILLFGVLPRETPTV